MTTVTSNRESTRADAWSALWHLITRVQRDKITPWLGFRNALGVALPLALGAAFGAVPVGLAVSTGALNVAFTDGAEPYRVRGWRMLAACVLVGFAVAIGETFGHNHLMAIALATCWAFGAGLLVSLSTTAADLGVVSLVTLLVYTGVPSSPDRAFYAGLLAFGGGLLQTALSLALWTIRRYGPERRALGQLYLELARSASTPVEAMAAPPATTQVTQAQQLLRTLGRDIEAERYRALLSQAERMRLSLLMVGRFRTRIQRERPNSAEFSALDTYLNIASRLLTAIGDALSADAPVDDAAELTSDLQALTDGLRSPDQTQSLFMKAVIRDARHQMAALTGQLRSALELTASATPEGLEAFDRREGKQPWRLRLMGTFAILWANLSLDSAACRHAIRLAVCVAIGDSMARSLSVGRFYWLPMTIAIVLKPDFSATFSRGVLRLAGTLVGLALATGIFHLLPPKLGFEVVLVFILMFLVRAIGGANYGIFVVAVTALVVVLIAITGVAPATVISARAVNTMLGGAIALLAYGLWPTWEGTHTPEVLATLLDKYREYFRAIRKSYTQPDQSFTPELDRVRHAARLARSNLEASIERLMAEPKTPPGMASTLSGILANTHRLVHAIMALEAGISGSPPAPAREQFQMFSNQVELTLYYLAAMLRGSRLTRRDLPDLREAHQTLTESGNPATERYAVVNVETDRITNSLNTLSEELLRWYATK